MSNSKVEEVVSSVDRYKVGLAWKDQRYLLMKKDEPGQKYFPLVSIEEKYLGGMLFTVAYRLDASVIAVSQYQYRQITPILYAHISLNWGHDIYRYLDKPNLSKSVMPKVVLKMGRDDKINAMVYLAKMRNQVLDQYDEHWREPYMWFDVPSATSPDVIYSVSDDGCNCNHGTKNCWHYGFWKKLTDEFKEMGHR